MVQYFFKDYEEEINNESDSSKKEVLIKDKESSDERAKDILGDMLQSSENYIYLIGAGCSRNSGGKVMKTFWDILSGKEIDLDKRITKINDFNKLKEDAGYLNGENLEELLTRIKIAENFHESFGTIGDKDKSKMESFRKEIEERLNADCEAIKLSKESVHETFIEKITRGRKLSLPRTKIFSLNYDTLFEDAGNRGGYSIIDGFSFSMPRTFNGNNYDLDIVKRNKNYLEKDNNFEKKVFHLYKLHGSVDWEEIDEKIIQYKGAKGKLIYPGSSKYEESYDMPYFEMISRFQQELRKDNVTLTISGYSFSDSHINSMIIEAFKTNPSLTIVIVGGSDVIDGEKELLKKDNIKTLNRGLNTNRVFLFNMYFEPFVGLIPSRDVETSEEKSEYL